MIGMRGLRRIVLRDARLAFLDDPLLCHGGPLLLWDKGGVEGGFRQGELWVCSGHMGFYRAAERQWLGSRGGRGKRLWDRFGTGTLGRCERHPWFRGLWAARALRLS